MRAAVELVLDLLDSEDTVVFLRRQAAALVDALRRPEDGGALRAAVAAHDDCHATWVALIAAAQRRGHDAAPGWPTSTPCTGLWSPCAARRWFHAAAPGGPPRLAAGWSCAPLGFLATLPTAVHARCSPPTRADPWDAVRSAPWHPRTYRPPSRAGASYAPARRSGGARRRDRAGKERVDAPCASAPRWWPATAPSRCAPPARPRAVRGPRGDLAHVRRPCGRRGGGAGLGGAGPGRASRGLPARRRLARRPCATRSPPRPSWPSKSGPGRSMRPAADRLWALQLPLRRPLAAERPLRPRHLTPWTPPRWRGRPRGSRRSTSPRIAAIATPRRCRTRCCGSLEKQVCPRSSLELLRAAGLPDGVVSLLHATAVVSDGPRPARFAGPHSPCPRPVRGLAQRRAPESLRPPSACGKTGGKTSSWRTPVGPGRRAVVALGRGRSRPGPEVLGGVAGLRPRSLCPRWRRAWRPGRFAAQATRDPGVPWRVISEASYRGWWRRRRRRRGGGRAAAGGGADTGGWFVPPPCCHRRPAVRHHGPRTVRTLLTASVRGRDCDRTLGWSTRLADASQVRLSPTTRGPGAGSAGLRNAAGNFYARQADRAVVGQQPFGGGGVGHPRQSFSWNLPVGPPRTTRRPRPRPPGDWRYPPWPTPVRRSWSRHRNAGSATRGPGHRGGGAGAVRARRGCETGDAGELDAVGLGWTAARWWCGRRRKPAPGGRAGAAVSDRAAAPGPGNDASRAGLLPARSGRGGRAHLSAPPPP